MTINDYKEFKVEDFVEDEIFRRWVLEQDKSLDFFWRAYFKEYPEQQIVVEEAIDLLNITNSYFETEQGKLPAQNPDFTKQLQDIFETTNSAKVQQQPTTIPKTIKLHSNRSLFYLLTIAASVGLILFFIHFNAGQAINQPITEYTTGNLSLIHI